MRAKALALIVAAGLSLAACGTESTEIDPGAAPSPSTDPDSPVSSSPQPEPSDPGDGKGGAERVVPRPGMADLHPVSWDRVVVGNQGHDLLVYFWSGVAPCYVLDHVDVDYGRKTVSVTLYEGHDPADPDTACIEIAVRKVVRVALDEPLGDRKVVDGSKPSGDRDY